MRFKKIPAFHRFFLLLLLSVALMFVDHHRMVFADARTAASTLTLPFQFLLNLPANVRAWFAAHYPDDTLRRQYEELQERQFVLESQLQRYASLRSENERLRELLHAPRKTGERALFAEIIEIGLDAFTQRVGINRGSESGIRPGQPVVTAAGVLGQVSEVGVRHSVVTLITHPHHSIPAEIRRNGLRTIVQGLGVANRVTVPFLPGPADIRSGDILITSGVGGRFPPGYKVARVREVIKDANRHFLSVHADAFADIHTSGKVLLLQSTEGGEFATHDGGGRADSGDGDNGDSGNFNEHAENDAPPVRTPRPGREHAAN